MKKYKNIKTMETVRTGEDGSVMVVSLLILVIASIIGVISINSATIETRVASLDRIEKENFYLAEGAAMQAAQLIENDTPADLRSRSEDYLNDDSVDFSDGSQWTGGQSDQSGNIDAAYAAADLGITQGSSLDMSNETQLHRFSVFGRHTSQGHEELIEIEYRVRF
jgi:hypothetical protein